MSIQPSAALARAVAAHRRLYDTGNILAGLHDPDAETTIAFDQALDRLRAALLDLAAELGQPAPRMPGQFGRNDPARLLPPDERAN